MPTSRTPTQDIAVMPYRRSALTFTATLVAFVMATFVANGSARADILERVVATINDQPIFLSEVRGRAAPFLPQVLQAPTETERMAVQEQLYREVLEAMINEELIRQAAERMEINITRSDVDQGIANLAVQNNMTADELVAAFAEQGVSEADYRRGIRNQVMRLRVLNQRVRGRVNITEDDVRREYLQRVNRANRQERFHPAYILLRVPAGASATEVIDLQRRAEEIHAGLTPENFPDAVDTHGGGDLGFLTQDELAEDLREAIVTLNDGAISAPVRSNAGFFIFRLIERERGGANAPAFDEVRDQLYAEMMNEAMGQQEQIFLRELQRDAIIVRRWGTSP